MKGRKKDFETFDSKTGIGLRAKRSFKAEDELLEYKGPTITDDELEDRDNRYLFQLNDIYMIDGSGLSNLARYINHACKPNAQAVVSNDETKITIEAIKRIKPGDEITINYGTEYFEEFIAPIGCQCKACRKSKKK